MSELGAGPQEGLEGEKEGEKVDWLHTAVTDVKRYHTNPLGEKPSSRFFSLLFYNY